MRRVLHIVCNPAEPLSAQIINEQRAAAEFDIRVFEFDQEKPDYQKLLQEIFEADSIEVW